MMELRVAETMGMLFTRFMMAVLKPSAGKIHNYIMAVVLARVTASKLTKATAKYASMDIWTQGLSR